MTEPTGGSHVVLSMPHRGQHHSGGPVLPDASPKVLTGRHDLHAGEKLLPGLDQCLLLLHDWSDWRGGGLSGADDGHG